MKSDWSKLEPYRVQPRGYESSKGDTFGWFVFGREGAQIRCMTADGEETGWDHVSVTVAYGKPQKPTLRMPKWEEMCFVKSLFWEKEETVIQFHPPESEYVSNHRTCLHLWKCVAEPFPLPPSILVGIKIIGELSR